jgi:hypothetical protein
LSGAAAQNALKLCRQGCILAFRLLQGDHSTTFFSNIKTMKPTQPLLKKLSRLALTTKQANKGFYKGTGTGSTGRHTKHGGYIIEWDKVRTYVVPKNLKDFKVWE